MAAQRSNGEARAGRGAGTAPTYPPPHPSGLSPVLERNIRALQLRRQRKEKEATVCGGLSSRRQEELVAGTVRTAQPQPIEAEDALQVREQHLDLLALPPRGTASVALRDVAGHVPRPLEERAPNLPRGFLGAAARLEAADIAVVLAGAIEELVVVHDRALADQNLAGRADIDVPLVIIGEVLARERPIGSFGLVEHRHVGFDPALMHQPPRHLG
jgi:hypothetical protein